MLDGIQCSISTIASIVFLYTANTIQSLNMMITDQNQFIVNPHFNSLCAELLWMNRNMHLHFKQFPNTREWRLLKLIHNRENDMLTFICNTLPADSLVKCDPIITYCQFSNIRRTQSPNINVSHLIFQLPLPNPLKPHVKLRIKM